MRYVKLCNRRVEAERALSIQTHWDYLKIHQALLMRCYSRYIRVVIQGVARTGMIRYICQESSRIA